MELSIRDFTDYRDFLAYRFALLKKDKPTFSLQYCANHLGVSKSFAKMVFDKKRHITLSGVPNYFTLLKLTPKEQMHLSFLYCLTMSHNSKSQQHFQIVLKHLENNEITPFM